MQRRISKEQFARGGRVPHRGGEGQGDGAGPRLRRHPRCGDRPRRGGTERAEPARPAGLHARQGARRRDDAAEAGCSPPSTPRCSASSSSPNVGAAPMIRTTAGGDEHTELIDPEWREGVSPEGDEPRSRGQQDYDTLVGAIEAGVRAEQSAAVTHEVVVHVSAADLEARRGQGWISGVLAGIPIPVIEREGLHRRDPAPRRERRRRSPVPRSVEAAVQSRAEEGPDREGRRPVRVPRLQHPGPVPGGAPCRVVRPGRRPDRYRQRGDALQPPPPSDPLDAGPHRDPELEPGPVVRPETVAGGPPPGAPPPTRTPRRPQDPRHETRPTTGPLEHLTGSGGEARRRARASRRAQSVSRLGTGPGREADAARMRIVALEEHFVVPELLDAWEPARPAVRCTVPGTTRCRGASATRARSGSPRWTTRASTCRCSRSRARASRTSPPPTPCTSPGRRTTRWRRSSQRIPTGSRRSRRCRRRTREGAAGELERALTSLRFRGALLNGRTGTVNADDAAVRRPLRRRRAAPRAALPAPADAGRAGPAAVLRRASATTVVVRVRQPRHRLALRDRRAAAADDPRRRLRPPPRPAGRRRALGRGRAVLPRAVQRRHRAVRPAASTARSRTTSARTSG